MAEHYDLILVGTGSGNSILNDEFSHLKVAVVEKGAFGGVGQANCAAYAGGGACDYGDFVGETAGRRGGDVAAEEAPQAL